MEPAENPMTTKSILCRASSLRERANMPLREIRLINPVAASTFATMDKADLKMAEFNLNFFE